MAYQSLGTQQGIQAAGGSAAAGAGLMAAGAMIPGALPIGLFGANLFGSSIGAGLGAMGMQEQYGSGGWAPSNRTGLADAMVGGVDTTMLPNQLNWNLPAVYNTLNSALDKVGGALNQYVNPVAEPQNTMLLNLPTYSAMTSPDLQSIFNKYQNQAVHSMDQSTADINNVVNRYANNPNINPDQAQQNDILLNAYQNALGTYNQTTTGSQGQSIANMYENAQNQFQPFIQTGQASNNIMGNILGTNGATAQGDAISNYLGSDIVQKPLDLGTQAIKRSLLASGMGNSGNAAGSLQKYGQTLGINALNQYIGNLYNSAQLGNSAANQYAGSVGQEVGSLQNQGMNQANITTSGANAVEQAILGNLSAQNSYLGNQNNALGLGAQSASAIAQLLQNQAQGATSAENQTFQNNAGQQYQQYQSEYQAQLAEQQSKINAMQTWAAQQGNLAMAYGQNTAQYQQTLGSQPGYLQALLANGVNTTGTPSIPTTNGVFGALPQNMVL